jgi:hypothetical protein
MGYAELYKSLGQENERLQKANEFLRQENEILKLEKKKWEQEKATQTAIVQSTIADFNADIQKYLANISELKEQIRVLADGHNN